MKTTPKRFRTIDGIIAKVDATGNIVCSMFSDPVIMAKNLDTIVGHSDRMVEPKPALPIRVNIDRGHFLAFHQNGDINIGCQRVTRATLLKAHAASLAARGKKPRK